MIEHKTLTTSGSTRGTAYTMSNRAASSDGKTHVVWLDRDHGLWAQTYHREGTRWDEPVLVGTGSDNRGGAALAVDSGGTLHAIYGAHNEPLMYSRSTESGDTREWDPQPAIGSLATYPSLVVDKEDTLHLCYRGSVDDEAPRGVIYRKKPKDADWSEAIKLVEAGGPPEYTHFENALHLASDGTLWMAYHIVRHGDGDGMAGVGFGVVRSKDKGATWETPAGETIELPSGPEADCIIEFDTEMDVRVGNLCTNNRGTPFFTVNRRGGDVDETSLYRWSGRDWEITPLLPFVEALVGPCAISSACAGSITDGNLLCLAATVCRPGGEWADASNEVVLLTSRDGGVTFRAHRISPGEPGVSNWLPTLERHTGHNAVDVPCLLYTHGEKGEACEPDTETEIRFVSLEEIARKEEQRVKDAFEGVLLLSGLDFPEAEKEVIWSWVEGNLGNYRRLREFSLDYDVEPCLVYHPPGKNTSSDSDKKRSFGWQDGESVDRPASDEELAFLPVSALSDLVRRKEISPVELTRLYLDRCEMYGEKLTCVVTLTDQLAMRQAKRAEEEITAGNYRGPLHGIPWGAKDLLAAKGYPTTWGATPFRNQTIDADAEVVQRLEQAGAVLVAKLSLGSLAMGPHWFGGTTRNPWNVKEDSSGSSAGPGSATAAGIVGFSVGTETQGSIVGPSHKCGIAGLRPTYGRVPRTGAMVVSWTMDKLGPMCRGVEDCAAVLSAIYGPDGEDLSVTDKPFEWPPERDLSGMRVGYLEAEFDGLDEEDHKLYDDVLNVLKSLGAEPKPVKLPSFPYGAVGMVLSVEGAAMFDDITRSGEIDLTTENDKSRWSKMYRVARAVPAVEYLRAQRIRRVLSRDIETWMGDWDVVLGAVFGGTNGSAMNLSGHPCLTVPCGFVDGMPRGINFLGRLYDEATILAAGRAYEQATEWNTMHPDMEKVLTTEIEEGAG